MLLKKWFDIDFESSFLLEHLEDTHFRLYDSIKMSNMTATLKYSIDSEKKMLLLAKLIRWKKVEDALTILEFTPKKAAKNLYKVVKSALSNARNNWWIKENLIVDRIDVWRWPKIKRFRFSSRSRVHWYLNHRSFVRVVLQVK